jgi:hypothetical protein
MIIEGRPINIHEKNGFVYVEVSLVEFDDQGKITNFLPIDDDLDMDLLNKTYKDWKFKVFK